MTPAPKASSYGADEDVKADRFDTATEKDMKLNAAIGKGVVDVPSSSSLPAIQKMNSMRTTRFGECSLTDSRAHRNRGRITIPHHMSQLLEAEDACAGLSLVA
jgi:hypothetical protein